MNKNRIFLTLTLLWYMIIWTISSIPSSKMPSYRVVGIDKVAHFLVYFILGMLCNQVLLSRNFKMKRIVMIYCMLFISAMLEEYHQIFVPGRSVSIYDFIANASGLLSSFIIIMRMHDKSR